MLAAALELIRERGAARLTTREVATRAGVSEGSVFYHFTDRTGLLTAVIEDGLAVLADLHGGDFGEWTGDPEDVFVTFADRLEPFLDRTLAVMVAAQSDAELRTGMAEFLLRNDFGPHRGIDALAGYLRRRQHRGEIRDDVDAQVVATMLLGPIYLQTELRLLIGPDYADRLPGGEAVARTLAALLSPPAAAS
jgi:AcrR family transcriptional regulator